MKVFLLVCLGMMGFSTFDQCTAQDSYWFTAPNGVKIVHHPIDSILVVEFADSISEETKKSILAQTGLRLLALPKKKYLHHRELNLLEDDILPQALRDTTLIMGVAAETNAAVRRVLRDRFSREVKGTLPAYGRDTTEKKFYFSPTGVGIVLYEDAPPSKLKDILRKFNLSVRADVKVGEVHWFHTFYLERFVCLELPRNADPFAMARALQNEPEVYTASPLCIDLGGPMHVYPAEVCCMKGDSLEEANFSAKSTNMWNRNFSKSTPAHLNKFRNDLRRFYWLTQTAPQEVVKGYLSKKFSPISGDSVKISMMVDKKLAADPLLFLVKHKFKLAPARTKGDNLPKADHDLWVMSIMIPWQELERVVKIEAVRKVWNVYEADKSNLSMPGLLH